MQPAKTFLWAAVVVAVLVTPQTQATKFALAALPAVASVGGLAALKVLKYVGLSKLKEKVSNSGLGSLVDLDDSGEDNYYRQQIPAYAPPPQSYYAPHPLPLASPGPAAFYIVPASSFGDYSYRGRRDVSGVSESGSEGVVAVRGDKQYFEVIGGLDQSGCVMRAVCELAGASTHTLTEDERSIMAAFSPEDKQADRAPTSWRGKYYQAAWVGKTAEDAASTCAKVYGRCPVPAKQLLEAMQVEEKQ
ncbi:uncharacterized protein LOC127002679 [Eriocheir sinensis]|uniref:uncharacterized protein LOC127002679 n=1 Tax=Eriocheir sinensis TaxID=95602 RepID=UPI0021CA5174|nr:uncharacterized protein LOC127002679 [Eriocheir sinensis]